MSNKKSTFKIKAVVTSLAVIYGTQHLVTALAMEPQQEPQDEEVSSISLNPGMYIPDESEFRNKPVSQEDVERTMALSSIEIASNAAIAEIEAGIEKHLAYPIEELNQTQIDLYNTNVAYYTKQVSEVKETAISEQEILEVLLRFRGWAQDYRAAIEAEKNPVEVKEVETVDNTPEESVSPVEHVSFGIPALDDQYLTYMPYTAITAKNTPHYRLQQLATTNEDGYRVYDDAICIALASSYGTKIGTLYNIKFDDGKEMRAVLSDNKSDLHTDKLHQYRDASGKYDGSSGNIVEIVFDVKNYEDMYAINRKINSDYSGKVVSITKIGVAEGFES